MFRTGYYYTFTQWQGKRTGPRQTLAMHAAKPRSAQMPLRRLPGAPIRYAA